jgi:hypothetical protein
MKRVLCESYSIASAQQPSERLVSSQGDVIRGKSALQYWSLLLCARFEERDYQR